MNTIEIAVVNMASHLRRVGRGLLMSHEGCLLVDQRGAVSFEVLIVVVFLWFSLLFPLTDLGVAGLKYITAWEALRAFGQSIQYNTPPDVTNPGSWQTTAIAKAASNYPISNFQVLCGDNKAVCSAGNLGPPRYYSYTTSITLTPFVLKSVMCGNANPCTFTLPYSERFQ